MCMRMRMYCSASAEISALTFSHFSAREKSAWNDIIKNITGSIVTVLNANLYLLQEMTYIHR